VFNQLIAYRDKKVVGVFVRFSLHLKLPVIQSGSPSLPSSKIAETTIWVEVCSNAPDNMFVTQRAKTEFPTVFRNCEPFSRSSHIVLPQHGGK
jgi:hypothetical protein